MAHPAQADFVFDLSKLFQLKLTHRCAPVHAGLSSVVVAPSIIHADGVDQAVVTIIPRDADGIALGTGLDLQVGTASLWPGRVTGAVDDLGNGTYMVRVVSAFPGSGTVQVTVEGIALKATPSKSAPSMNGAVGGPCGSSANSLAQKVIWTLL